MTLTDFEFIAWIWIGVALVVFPFALKITAPYGRHSTKKAGKTIPNKIAWVIMEVPSPLLFSIFFFTGEVEKTWIHWLLYALFMIHYLNRTFIWPLRTKTKGKEMPIIIAASAFFFNMINGPLNGYFLGHFAVFPSEWALDPRFIIGLSLFAIGFCINLYHDNLLINLRKPGETGYKIPKGGLFKYISAPNLFGEMVEWGGWALMTWSVPTLSFVVWTWANLLPRALDHHKWYLKKFNDYPKSRKAVIPKIL